MSSFSGASLLVWIICTAVCGANLRAQRPEILAGAASASSTVDHDAWWKHAIVYEVYPRSFADSDGDGAGDLNGVTEHLDYLQQLGVDAIWLAPIYPSPQVDFGYDIADYRSIDPQYGTLADFDRLLQQAKQRGIRIVLDMVLNHTSDQSAWFQQSASSRNNAKADWYVWNDGIPATSANLTGDQKKAAQDGPHGRVVPPNNWKSYFGDCAWTWVPSRQQFYYHLFYTAQPDLNWRNPAVEKAMFDVMRFWLDRGVAGFRLDAVSGLYEDPHLRNVPAGSASTEGYQSDLPEVHALLRRLRSLTDSYPGERVLIAEVLETSMDKLDRWYGGSTRDEVQLPMDYIFGFPHLVADARGGVHDRLDASFYRKQLIKMSTELHGSRPFIFFDNHDQVRSMDRFGDGTHNLEIARVVAALLLTAPATAQTYYGAPIGMVNTDPKRREDVKDPVGRSQWPANRGRDGERTPMQWTPGPQAGFSTNPATWLPIPPSSKIVNVQSETANPNSLLSWYRTLIGLRRSLASLRDGDLAIVDENNEAVLSFVRTDPDGANPILVTMNMTDRSQTVSLTLKSAHRPAQAPRTLLASPGQRPVTDLNSIQLGPYAVWMAELR